MDNKLLLEIFRTPARTKAEILMAQYITKYLREIDVSFTKDITGNIYNVGYKDRPLLSAHMDTVQDEIDARLAVFTKIRGGILSGYGVIGGDDKCGIYIILELLKEEKFNFVFSVQEESGADGIKQFVNTADLSNVLYGLVLDRRGSTDLICTNNGYGTKEFENTLLEIGKVYGFSVNSGTFSDANFISKKISCANISVGYHNPHSKDEFVNLEELKNSMNFVHAMMKNVTNKFGPPEVKNTSVAGYHCGWDDDVPSQYFGFRTNYKRKCDVCFSRDKETKWIPKLRKNICEDCMNDIIDDYISSTVAIDKNSNVVDTANKSPSTIPLETQASIDADIEKELDDIKKEQEEFVKAVLEGLEKEETVCLEK